ncbi:PAS domain-containing protein [Leptospira levettii]|uniref:PAS domain-containing protein n=1 Tax=Leptospira levettii TaxID=2023178 RepID=UPI00143869CB|nr:PAS domain-containing protein [Leptospira levettii]
MFQENKENGMAIEYYNSLPVAIFQISKQGIINFINSEAQELFAISQTELYQKLFTTLLSETSKESFHTFISTICSGKNKNSCLAEIIVRQNLTKQVSLYGNLSLDGDWIQLVVVESTDEKETDITYKKEFEDISNVAQVGRWELNLVTGALKWSKKIYEIFELDPNLFQPSYETFLSVIHPDDREKVNQAYSQSLIDKKNMKLNTD